MGLPCCYYPVHVKCIIQLHVGSSFLLAAQSHLSWTEIMKFKMLEMLELERESLSFESYYAGIFCFAVDKSFIREASKT